MRSRVRAGLLLLALALAGEAARGQEDPATQKLLSFAFQYRHDGQYLGFDAAVDQILKNLPAGEAKKTIASEAYDVAAVESDWQRAARMVRGIDPAKELVATARAGFHDAALRKARDSGDALVEGKVLRAVGKLGDAVLCFERAGTPGALERGEVLLEMGRAAEAALAFDAAGERFLKAVALEKAGDPGTTTAYEYAKPDTKARLEGLIGKAKENKAALEGAAKDDIVKKQRARFALAETYGKLAEAYDRYSVAFEKTKDRATAAKLEDNARQFATLERATMNDGGTDKFGIGLVGVRGLDARDHALDARIRALKGP